MTWLLQSGCWTHLQLKTKVSILPLPTHHGKVQMTSVQGLEDRKCSGFINNFHGFLCWVHMAICQFSQVHSCLWSFCCDFSLSCWCSFFFRAHRVLIPTTTAANILWTLDRGLTTSSGTLVRVQLPVTVFSYSALPHSPPTARMYRVFYCTGHMRQYTVDLTGPLTGLMKRKKGNQNKVSTVKTIKIWAIQMNGYM